MLLNLLFIVFILTKVSESAISNGTEDFSEDVTDDKSSLAFVFDTTGSMHNDLAQLREGAEMILSTALEESNIIGDFVFVPFHDPTVGPGTVTRDKTVFHRALAGVSVYGGGDCPERSLGGIDLALTLSRPRSFLYVFTDATAADHRRVQAVLDAVQRKQSQIVFVLTGHCNDLDKPTFRVYQQLAAASNGQIFNLNKTNVHRVLDFVRSSIKGRMVNLGSSVNPAGYNYTQEIPVDGSLSEVTVSVSGAEPRVSVIDPRGEPVTGPPKLVTTLDLAEIMVVKVVQPEAGNWRISVGSSQEHSVKVAGLSNLTFEHGFSVQPPAGMNETSYRPLQGTYNHLLLQTRGAAATLEFAEVVDLSGDTLYELPLQRVADDTYAARPFIPPDHFFYIAVNGKDVNGDEIRRMGATAVQVKQPDVPYLSAPKKISAHAHSRVALRCKVESLVPVTAAWSRGTGALANTSSLQTTSIEHVIEDVTENDAGTYRCRARNVAGASHTDTRLVLLVDPPSVSIEPETLSLDVGDRANISCTVFSEALLLKFQFISHNNNSAEVLDIPVHPTMDGVYMYTISVQADTADSGRYSCIAANRGGSSNKTLEIIVRSNPTAQILGPHELSVQMYHNITIYCSAQNANAISWSKNGNFCKESQINDTFTDFLVVNVTEDTEVTCKSVGKGSEATDTVHITALMKPEVRVLGPKSILVLNGTSMEVSCEVSGNPAPRILWYRGSEERFLNHTLTMMHPGTYRSVLQLNSSTENITGTYFCVAESALGIHHDSVSVRVRTNMTLLRGFNDTVVELYHPAEIICNITAYPPPVLTWYHNNTQIDKQFTEDVNTRISEDNKKLVIRRVDFENLGLYTCIAENEFEKMELKGSLNVDGLDAPILLKEQPARRMVKQGDTTKLSCSVLKGKPVPTMRWEHKNVSSNDFETLQSKTEEQDIEVTMTNVTVGDAGVYRCVAENIIGRDELETELVVHYPPSFLHAETSEDSQNPLEVEIGHNVKFSCEAVGSPPPIVVWSKNGRPVVYGHNSYSQNGTLVIEKVSEYDSGLYTCLVRSPLGAVNKNFTLLVFVPPYISPPSIDLEQEYLEGELVELPCAATAVPSPLVTWMHNGNAIDNGRMYIDEFGIRFIANLTDFGDYTCFAKNKYGNASLSYSLLIWVPPYIKPPLEVSINAIAGQNTTLQCNVVGFPLPTIKWEFKKQVLNENTTTVSFNEVGNLYITNTSSKDDGLYACVADNIAGVIRKFIYLTVNEHPKILEENYIGTYLATNMDSVVTIPCKVTGKPKPYIMWSKDNVYLSTDVRYAVGIDGSLTIKTPTVDLSGNYTCLAKNSVGSMNKTVELQVYVIPATETLSDGSFPVKTVMENGAATLECPAKASSTDTVKWYKDANIIATGKLEIKNITREDQRSFACVVSNAVGSAFSAINLNVEWPPKFVDDYDEDVENNNGYEINTNNNKNSNNVKEKTRETPDGKIKNGYQLLNAENSTVSIITEQNDSKRRSYKEDPNSDRHDKGGIQVIDAVKGDDIYLDCTVDAKPTAKTKWLLNSTLLFFADKPKLALLDVRTQNTGTYKCVVGNKHGTVTKEFEVNILEPPFISEYDMLDVMLMEGVNATLECEVQGNPKPTVRWTNNNTEWHVEGTFLVSNNITSDAAGVYRCDATNHAGRAHIIYKVEVISSAMVEDIVIFKNGKGISVTKSVEAELGSKIRVACKATGNPNPTTQWLRNGVVVSQNTPGASYVDLTIDGVDSTHAGVYSCATSNEGGNDERKVRLEVLEPPNILRSLFQSESGFGNSVSVEVLAGQAYYLPCHAYGNPMPEIYWFKDGLPLMLFDDSMVSSDYGEVLRAPRAQREQAGNYTCVARSSAGNTSLSYLLDVLVPPTQPKESFQHITTLAGKPLILNCPVEGSPAPYVTWIKHPYIEIIDTPRLKLSDDNVTLILPSTQVSDSGNYSCIMTNKAGASEASFYVTVLKPPSIAGSQSGDVVTYDVGLMRSIVLKCEAEGQPLPRITWLKDTQPISESVSNIHRVLGNSLLAIWRVGARDAGQYICVAENSAGAAHRRYNLRVKVPGKWSSWGGWSYCNVTCGDGHQRRARTCQYIDDNDIVIDATSATNKFILDESACKGPANDTRKCHMPACEEPLSAWSAWSAWSACSASCGAGTQARTRRCRHRPCAGDNVQIRKCPNLPRCEDHRATGKENNNNEVFDTDEQFGENNLFAPEAVYEMELEVVNSHYSPDVEEFYVAAGHAGTKPTSAYFEVRASSNLDGSEPGACQFGYRYNGTTHECEDIDECVFPHNQCHATQLCANVAGGYRCACAPGLLALGAGQRCMDINECAQEISGCEFACVNVVGGYVCACPHNMRLHTDKHHCYPVQSQSSVRRQRVYSPESRGEYLSTSVEYPARYKHMRN